MNRRSFLRFLGLAPVAAPMAAQAMLAGPSPVFIGLDAGGLDRCYGVSCIGSRKFEIEEIAHWFGVPPHQVHSYAIDKYFVRMIAPTAPRGALSPETNLASPFPTAVAGSQRLSAQASSDQPSRAESLCRSWGSFSTSK